MLLQGVTFNSLFVRSLIFLYLSFCHNVFLVFFFLLLTQASTIFPVLPLP